MTAAGQIGRALAPSLTVAIGAAVAGSLPAAAPVAVFLRTYPALLFGLAIALGVVFRSSRVAAAVLALAIAQQVVLDLGTTPLVSEELGRFSVNAVGVLLPLNLALAAASRERPVWSRAGLLRLVAVAGQGGFAAVAWLAVWGGLIAAVEARLVASAPPSWGPLCQPSLAAYGAAVVVAVVVLMRRRTPVEAAILVGLGLSFTALRAAPGSDEQVLLLSGGGAALAVAVLQGASASVVGDPLTGLPGRRAFDERLAGLRNPYVIALVDIDHFKRVNDTRGHPVGDQVLRMVAARLREVGGGGTAYRVGGEEFALVFPGKSLAAVEPHLDAVRRAVAASPFVLRGADRPRRKPRGTKPAPCRPETLGVTVSIGAAAATTGTTVTDVLSAADKALYRAKAAGRNTVVAAG